MKISGKTLKNALKSLDITQSKAATLFGVSRQTVVTWTGKSELDDDTCRLISEKLNIDLTNYSSGMQIVKPEGQIVTVNSNRKKSAALIPFYNADFMAGNAELYYNDGNIYPDYYMDVPEFSGCTAFRAYSDSMETRIKSGNILFGVKLDDWQSHLEYGQIYGITCNDGRRYLKYIRKYQEDEENFFLLKSENPNYDDFKLPKSKIKNIWLIEGWLDKRT